MLFSRLSYASTQHCDRRPGAAEGHYSLGAILSYGQSSAQLTGTQMWAIVAAADADSQLDNKDGQRKI